MEEKKDGMGLVDRPAPNTPWWQSGLIEKLQLISLGSSEETSNSKGFRTEHDLGSSAFQRASQTLWDTGKLAEPIPDGFYFVTPERRFKELFDTIPSLDELYTLGDRGA
ncbi:Mitogen activated protein kinase kinase kinase-related [Forsythia ovata]|uniref:Mitogen activated protein kinase kinase kinase-related n=1 Tax=Forsythia ovata TaxID=205694 RepID=A0ABD1S2Y5_9LAMI